MPIPITCPACQTEYDLADHLGGKRVVCRECGRALDVPAPAAEDPARAGGAVQDQPRRRSPERVRRAEDDRPRRRREADEDDEDRRGSRPVRESSGGLVLAAAVGGLCLFVCAGGSLSLFFMRAAPVPQAANQAAFQAAPRPAAVPRGGGAGNRLIRPAEGPVGDDEAQTHLDRGNALFNRGQFKEAEAAYREAIRLKLDAAPAHSNLGLALLRQFRFKEAETAFRNALRLQPDDALATSNLGFALRDQGRFAEALEQLRRGDELGARVPDWPDPAHGWVRQCERLIELDRRLPAFLAGDARPASAAERAELIGLCVIQKHFNLAAARLAAEAPADDPQLIGDTRFLCFYNGACGAALAAGGQGEDARQLPDKVVVMLRRQALRWLRAELAEQANMAAGNQIGMKEAVRRQMMHWKQDPDLAAVRDPQALARLPGDEQEAWRRLWADVDALGGAW